MLDWKPISPRLCVIRIKGKFRNISIINVHAPTEEKDEDEKNAFYDMLEGAYDNCPRNDVKIVIGNLNAKIGREAHHQRQTGLHSLHTENNDNGLRVIVFAAGRDMVVGSTMFPRKDIYKYIWISHDQETRNQIDYVLIDAWNMSSLMLEPCEEQTWTLIIT